MDSKTFTDNISRDTGIAPGKVESLLKGMGEILTEMSEELSLVSLPRFGTFQAIKEDERVDVDLSTGRRILLPPFIHLEFNASGALRNSIASGKKGGQR